MVHFMLRDSFTFSPDEIDRAVLEASEVAGLSSRFRGKHRSFSEFGPSSYQVGYSFESKTEVFVFDLSGMSLEKSADRYLLWAGIGEDWTIVYVAPSYTRSFMEDLLQHQGISEVYFLRIPEESERFEVLTSDLGAPDPPEDKDLDALLMQQKRPERPKDLASARKLVESYVAEALKGDLSPPEARVEATRICAFLEFFSKEKGRAEGRNPPPEEEK